MQHFRRAAMVCSIGIALIVLLSPIASSAATLVWDASSGTVDGYKVYWGINSSDQSNSTDVGNVTQYNLDNLPLSEGVTYYIFVSAYNEAGESSPCAPVVFTPGDNTPPVPPVGLTTE